MVLADDLLPHVGTDFASEAVSAQGVEAMMAAHGGGVGAGLATE